MLIIKTNDEMVISEIKNNPLTEEEKKNGTETVQVERVETKKKKNSSRNVTSK